jgi:AAA+ superfamily predicted ATPase
MSTAGRSHHEQLAAALACVRGRLAAELPGDCAAAPASAACPRRRALPWLCWGAAAIALAAGWLWPHFAGEHGAAAARVTGTFFALGSIVAGAVLPRPAAPAGPVLSDQSNKSDSSDKSDPLTAFTEDAPLLQVRSRFSLSEFETRVLLLCAAAELDPAIPELLRRLQDGALRQPTFALAQRLFPDHAWDTLSENRPLLHWIMVEARQQDGRPLAQSPLRIDDGLLQYLIGNPAPDARLAPYHISFPPQARPDLLSAQQDAAAGELHAHIAAAAGSGDVPVAVLSGPFPLAQQMIALAVVAASGGSPAKLLRIPVSLLPAEPRDSENISRLWAREAILHGLALYLENDDTPEAHLRAVLRRFFLSPRTLYFFAAREPAGGIPRDHVALKAARPAAEEQQEAWFSACASLLLALSADDAMCLADQFHLDLPSIAAAVASAQGMLFADSAALRRHLQLTVRAENRSALDLLAQRIEPRADMDDLVLPVREKEQLRKFIAHVEKRRLVFSEWGMGGKSDRGQGTAALFSGESGTGKTLAAEVIAAALGLDLYRIDLSAVVDKYIGETEKNLRRIFDAAESGGVILFFDEADALFGKRSEVKDSHDRYANIQINYLLQRLETYRGPAVLATNLGRSMDHAFLRRLRFIVRFPQPGRDERRAIWEKSLAPLRDDFFPPPQPDGAPQAVLALTPADFHTIAAANLSGGEIRNAAIAAAFLAATARTPVTRTTVEEAIRDESHKAGRPAPAGTNGSAT